MGRSRLFEQTQEELCAPSSGVQTGMSGCWHVHCQRMRDIVRGKAHFSSVTFEIRTRVVLGVFQPLSGETVLLGFLVMLYYSPSDSCVNW